MSKNKMAYLVLANPSTKLSPFTLGPLGITSRSAKVPLPLWADLGAKLKIVRSGYQWVVGDWITYGEWAYGEASSQHLEDLGLAPETASNYANVAQAFAYPRRRGKLPFAHHAVVYKLPTSQQDEFLDLAVRDGLSEKDVRKLVRAARAKHAPSHPTPEKDVVQARVTILAEHRQE